MGVPRYRTAFSTLSNSAIAFLARAEIKMKWTYILVSRYITVHLEVRQLSGGGGDERNVHSTPEHMNPGPILDFTRYLGSNFNWVGGQTLFGCLFDNVGSSILGDLYFLPHCVAGRGSMHRK